MIMNMQPMPQSYKKEKLSQLHGQLTKSVMEET